MNMKNIFLIALITLAVAGCGSQTIKTEVRVEVVAPPDSLLVDVDTEQPPVTDQYSGLRWIDKEEILVDKFRAQSLNVETANKRFKSLREWKEKTLKHYEKKE